MKNQAPNILLLLYIPLLLLHNCTTTSTRKKPPIFTINSTAISEHINNILSSEEINIDGMEIKKNDKVTSELTINLINPRQAPTDTVQLKKIGAKIASLIKQVIKNSNDYDIYTVLFTTRKEDAAFIKTNYIGFEYLYRELNPNVYFVSLGDKLDSLPLRAIGKTSFKSKDSVIYAVLLDYNFDSTSHISYKIFKNKLPDEALVTENKLGIVEPTATYLITTLNVKYFYKVKELQSGDYRFEYLINDSIVGAKNFTLE